MAGNPPRTVPASTRQQTRPGLEACEAGRWVCQDGSVVRASRKLVHQRVRNRIIEFLELASSFDEQIEYQIQAPVNLMHEVINQWEDWVHKEPSLIEWEPGVFSEAERAVMTDFHKTWLSVIDRTRHIEELNDAHKAPAWNDLRAAASASLLVFKARGRMSEDEDH